LDALDDALFTRIDRKILALAENPRPAGCKKLKGYKDQWRVRVGDWRALYIIDDAAKLVTITRLVRVGSTFPALSEAFFRWRAMAFRQ
jgi:mRNA interferase RelE/StbE